MYSRPTIDWLDTNTVVMHCNTTGDDINPVLLWDTRVHRGGTASRFSIKERTTGVLCPANNGDPASEHSVLVSTNHSLRLYDTRMPHMPSRPDRPLISFHHIHEGPQLHFAYNKRGLVAAADRDKTIQIYSTRSGRCLGSPDPFHKEQATDPLMVQEWAQNDFARGLQWYEDKEGGTSLLCFSRNATFMWRWDTRRCIPDYDRYNPE